MKNDDNKTYIVFDDLISMLQEVRDKCKNGEDKPLAEIAKAAVATARYLGFECGINGADASIVMWNFITRWLYSNNKSGLRLICYDSMLFPDLAYQFDKTISKRTFEALQWEAQSMLNRGCDDPELIAHWQSIVDGEIPFGYKIGCEE